MYVQKRNDQTVMKAIEAQNRGDWTRAASLFNEAGNQYRSYGEKQELWKAAEKARRIRDSD